MSKISCANCTIECRLGNIFCDNHPYFIEARERAKGAFETAIRLLDKKAESKTILLYIQAFINGEYEEPFDEKAFEAEQQKLLDGYLGNEELK